MKRSECVISSFYLLPLRKHIWDTINLGTTAAFPRPTFQHGSFTSFSFFHFFALFSLPLHCIEIRQRMKGKKKEASRGKEKHNTKDELTVVAWVLTVHSRVFQGSFFACLPFFYLITNELNEMKECVNQTKEGTKRIHESFIIFCSQRLVSFLFSLI